MLHVRISTIGIVYRSSRTKKTKKKSIIWIDEQLPQWSLSVRPLKKTTWGPAGEQAHRNEQSSKKVVLFLTSSDKDRSHEVVVEPTLSANCNCQRFSPETLLHFLKGKMKVVLKGSWSVEVHEAALVGIVNEKGGDAQRREVLACPMF